MKHEHHDVANEEVEEVELSAVDLVVMSLPKEPAREAGTSDVDGVEASVQVPAARRRIPSWLQQASGMRALGIFALAIVAGIAVAAHYDAFKLEAEEPAMVAMDWTPLPDKPALPEPEIIEPQPEPTRFVNPFDENEVFELEPGLSEDQAREIVAQLLLERARERVR